MSSARDLRLLACRRTAHPDRGTAATARVRFRQLGRRSVPDSASARYSRDTCLSRTEGGGRVSADYDFDLGACSFPVSTQSAETQRWFDRGLVWCYAFAHEEAVHCFRVRLRSLLQQAVGEVRSGGPRVHAGHGPGRRPAGARPRREHIPGRAGPRRGARAAVSVVGPARRLRPVERRLRRRDARGAPIVLERLRRVRAVRRGAHEPHAVGAVEPRDGRAGRGSGHRRGARGARGRHRGAGSRG